jgi:hypothetical protein
MCINQLYPAKVCCILACFIILTDIQPSLFIDPHKHNLKQVGVEWGVTYSMFVVMVNNHNGNLKLYLQVYIHKLQKLTRIKPYFPNWGTHIFPILQFYIFHWPWCLFNHKNHIEG